MTTRKSDMKLERLAAAWLDERFWKPVFGERFKRWDDRSHQLNGVDLGLSCDSGTVYFDEKLKAKGCLNQIQQYVGFEMSLILHGDVREGWFGGDWAMADWYATIGLSATVQDHAKLEDVSQITGADVLWTNKKALVKWVESFGVSVKDLLGMSDCMREAYDMGYMETRKKFQHGAFWLTLSTSMDEMPVNLVIPRRSLEQIQGTRRFRITGEGVERII